MFLQPVWHERLSECQPNAIRTRKQAMHANFCYICTRIGPGDFVHLATNCAAPAVAHRREVALGHGEWARIILDITAAIHSVAKRDAVPIYLRNAILQLPYDSPQAQFITARVITCAPWTVREVSPEWVIAHRLGTMFDKAYDRALATPLADTWARHAKRVLRTIAGKWWELLPPQSRRALTRAGLRVRATA